jgi:NADPH-dependent 2,4-dienoyl-CoA reductase/sulfur reductase-like enzyme/rhodanese-related sulfurtransferase
MDRILEFLNHHMVKSATVVGAGFVGLEVVEQLHLRGIKITLVERLPQVLGPLDVEMARMIEAELEKHNVDLLLDASVSQLISSGGQISHVVLGDGRQHPADLIIVGAGVRPRVELAMQAGLTIGGAGGVQVNQFCQTSDPNIYAAGDMIEYQHGVLGRPMRIPLAGPANRSGRVAGEHAGCGKSSGMPPVQGTSIVRVFGLSAGTTGLNERMCRAHNIDHRCATIQATHHASYFPGAKNMTLKLIYSPKDGRILGAQAVGEEGIDKRLDVVATALHFRGTVNDLAGLDLAYAPPFGSAKDPIHMAAFVAQNDLATAPSLLPSDADLEDLQIVDVRNSGEIAKLPLVGAVHIPVDEFSDRWQSLDPNRPTVVVCHSGKRAHVAACHLRGMGFANVKNLNGGISIRTLFRR